MGLHKTGADFVVLCFLLRYISDHDIRTRGRGWFFAAATLSTPNNTRGGMWQGIFKDVSDYLTT